MKTNGFTYWQDGEQWIGYLDLTSGVIPNVRRHAELEIA
jgi:hypothetical protein